MSSNKNRKKMIILMLLSLGLAIVIGSCYPGDSLSVTETDTVTTFRNKDANFATKRTYAMPDSVIHVDGDQIDDDADHSQDRTILAAIDRNMSSLNYQKVSDPNQADVHVLPIVTTREWKGGTCYPSYWCYWYCYPGWCYPVTYTYTTGTLLINMLDPQDGTGNSDADALWLGGINGLLSGSVNNTARINSRVDQAFTQSPYLGEGK